MMETQTFVSLFETNQEELKASLSGCTLPKDAKKIQSCVSKYLSTMFDSNGELRMSLTQSEDYILQAAISLLNAQQKMASSFADEAAKTNPCPPKAEEKVSESTKNLKQENITTLSGSAIGGIGGGLIFGTWGAVFGAIAGTALVLYMNTTNPKPQPTRQMNKPVTPTDKPINVDAYLEIIKNICQSIDTLIETFRAQIKRVVQKYEEQEKPSLEREYRGLLEGIQSMVGYKRVHSAVEPKYIGKLQERIEDIVELLDNYNLTVEDYTDDNAHHFELLTSPNTIEPKMVTPAILKNGEVVLKGKVFVKE